MNKEEYKRLMMLSMCKKASDDSVVAETVGSYLVPSVLNNALPGNIGGGLNVAGGMGAWLEPADDDPRKAILDSNANKYISILPAVGAYKSTRRKINTDKLYGSESPRARDILRQFGRAGLPLTTAVIGALINSAGARNTYDQVRLAAQGSIVGGLLGSIPTVIGAVAAGLTKRRTDEEQRKASTGSYAKFLIPGYAEYDEWKTIGKSRDIK